MVSAALGLELQMAESCYTGAGPLGEQLVVLTRVIFLSGCMLSLFKL